MKHIFIATTERLEKEIWAPSEVYVCLTCFLLVPANVWDPSPQFLRAVVFGDGHLWKATWVRWVLSASIDFAISDFPVSYEEYMNVLWVTKDLSWQPKADYINISSFRKLASKNIALVPICAMTGIRWEVRGDNVTLLHPLSLRSLPCQVQHLPCLGLGSMAE